MEAVAFGIDLKDFVCIFFRLFDFHGVHEGRIEGIADFRKDFRDAFIGEGGLELVVDETESLLVVLGFLAVWLSA